MINFHSFLALLTIILLKTWVRPLFGYFKIGNGLFTETGTEKQRQGNFFDTKYFELLLKSKMIKIHQYETQQPKFDFLNRSFCRKASAFTFSKIKKKKT